jgi:hypothetical protein
MSDSHKGKPRPVHVIEAMQRGRKPVTTETRIKMSNAHRGENHHYYQKQRSQETIDKIKETKRGASHHLRKSWIITNINGDQFVVESLSEFCRQHQLSYQTLLGTAKSGKFTRLGWKITPLDK